jgi:hypothetical protein
VGRDLGDPAEGYTHACCVGVADPAALQRYFDDPVHREGDLVFAPLLARLRRRALTDDPDPATGDEIMEMYRRKMAGDPGWAAVLAAIPDFHPVARGWPNLWPRCAGDFTGANLASLRGAAPPYPASASDHRARSSNS